MEIRNLGQSGLRVSSIGLGCNNFGGRIDLEATRKVVHRALDLGITLFDTADVYGERGGSETCLGQVLGDRRKDIVLATKFALPMNDAETLKGASRHYIMRAVEDSLRRLKTDWIDLYLQHRPDPLTPDRGDAARPRRSRPPGQGSLHRLLQPARLAGGRSAMDREERGVEPVRIVPGRILARRSQRGGAGIGTGNAEIRHGPVAVLSTRQRPADREIQAQRTAAPGCQAGSPRRASPIAT